MEEPVYCDCTRRPMLGILKTYPTGKPYFHVKSWKQQKPIVELEIAYPVRIRCRICLRWHQITPRKPKRETRRTPTHPPAGQGGDVTG